MTRTCTHCGDPIDLTAWPIVEVIDGEPALFCHVTCHNRWRNDWTDRHPPTAR